MGSWVLWTIIAAGFTLGELHTNSFYLAPFAVGGAIAAVLVESKKGREAILARVVIDATGDGEFCVALRCALLRGPVARCYAGNGIVRDSNPASELAETEVKLQALLPLLSG